MKDANAKDLMLIYARRLVSIGGPLDPPTRVA